ncbi:hypothetical protein [Dictyobacter arantiisoli]|uniref:Uncharacterized protein n=1 Tax=Dictyobacter arantiisoli TaxID=2014874 RepID=A0A5A5T8K5_9CHLR|nr:hypothetical protein [Dictyobacter arantiisoli]GCF07810.1 hypothetical protein KDI_13740 [Dictyobacter arantiisoli]
MFDVAPLVPEARAVAQAAARIYWQHLQNALQGILIHGSALKGGIIEGCSDIDFRLYLSATLLTPAGQLPLPLSMAIQRDLTAIDLAPFQYIQAYVTSSQTAHQHGGPLPGAYHMLYGTLPVPEATLPELLQRARETIERAQHVPARVAAELLEAGGNRLQLRVRYMCTDVWPVMYSVLALQAPQPLEIWRLSKQSAMYLLPANAPLGRSIRRFSQCVHTYYEQSHSTENALAVLEQGVAFLEAATHWYASYR